MKDNVDILEITSFINAFDIKEKNANSNFCIDHITESIDENYLMDRAKIIKSEYKINDKFNNAIHKLATICNDDSKNCKVCPINKYCNHYIKKQREKINVNSLKMIDLFCGAGGLSLGFTQEGFITCLANDIEECCVDTYAHNHPETPRDHIVLGDIQQLVDNVEDYLMFKDIDIIVGGPPCQGFSEANRQRLIDDPRNQLYKNFVKIVKKVQPKFFVMENVKGMLKVKSQVIEDFENVGYKVSAYVLNARDYGVPQNRERLIYIGNKLDIDNELIFDEIREYSDQISNYVLDDALEGLRPLKALRIKNATQLDTEESGRKIEKAISFEMNDYISLINQGKFYPIVCNHKARYNNDRDIEIFGRLHPGDKSDDPKIADIMPYKSRKDIFKDKYYKLEPNKICKTITAHMKFDCNMYIHPYQARGLTPREAARIQSYPDDYFFRGTYTKTYMQIGNSVPPLLGRAIAKIVKKYIK